MKKIIKITILVLFQCISVYAQNTPHLGLHLGLAIPAENISYTHNINITFGAAIIYNTANPIISVPIGVSYFSLPGKKKYYGTYNSADIFSIFVGPQIGEETGVYFFPAITANFNDDGAPRYGIDIGGGYLMPSNKDKAKLNLSIKYSYLNLLGKENGESIYGVARVLVGINF